MLHISLSSFFCSFQQPIQRLNSPKIHVFQLAGWALLLVVGLLVGCGGDNDRDPDGELPEMRLTGVAIEGGALTREFDPNVVGPYRIEMDEPNQDTLTIAANSDVVQTLRYVYPFVNSDGNIEITSETLNAGEALEWKNIPEGDTTIRVDVFTSDEFQDHVLSYSFDVHRQGSRGELVGLSFDTVTDPASIGDESGYSVISRFTVGDQYGVSNWSFTIDPESETNEYTLISQSYNTCSILLNLVPSQVGAIMTLNGEDVSIGEAVPVSLIAGETTVLEIVVTSEDEQSSQTYTISIPRAAPTEEDLADDSRLANVSIETGEMEPFACMDGIYRSFLSDDGLERFVGAYSGSMDRRNESTSILVEAAEGASITITEQLADDDDEETLDMVSGEPWPVSLDIATVKTFQIDVTSPNGENTDRYVLNVSRLFTNRVYVDSVAALNSALDNASLSDEIILESGDYVGELVSDTAEDAAFFVASKDGTQEQPIILRGEGLLGVRLQGAVEADDATATTVLRIAGDNWIVRNLVIANAGIGITIDGAENTVVETVALRNLAERGIAVLGASENTQIITNSFSNNSVDEAQPFEDYTAIVIGSGEDEDESTVERTTVNNNAFGSRLTTLPLQVNAQANQTVVDSNVFNMGATQTSTSLLTVKGQNTSVRLNSFDITQNTLDQLILVDASQQEGSETRIFQNTVELDGEADVPLLVVNRGDQPVLVGENRGEQAGETILLESSGIQAISESPMFYLKPVVASDLCLSVKPDVTLVNAFLEVDEVDEEGNPVSYVEAYVPSAVSNVLALEACDTSLAVQWSFDVDSGGFTRVKNAAYDGFVLSNESDVRIDGGIASYAAMVEEPEGDLAIGFQYRWRLVKDRAGYTLESKQDSVLGLAFLNSVAFNDDDELVIEAFTTQAIPGFVFTTINGETLEAGDIVSMGLITSSTAPSSVGARFTVERVAQ